MRAREEHFALGLDPGDARWNEAGGEMTMMMFDIPSNARNNDTQQPPKVIDEKCRANEKVNKCA